MKPAPEPSNELERLRALKDLVILDTPPDERFDRVVRFAAEQLQVPVALVSLVDKDRQWFKSKVGTEVQETPRDISFCGHAIIEPALFLVGDASRDERFADNPLVTGDAHIRFYAGVPVSAPTGERVGTLCVLDTVPRQLDAVELATLEALRTLVNEALVGSEGDDA